MHSCNRCGELHENFPAFHADRPTPYWDVPESRRESDVYLTSDSCVIAEQFFFIRGLIEIPISGTSDHFVWGVWVSLSEANFLLWQDNYEVKSRDHVGPFFGWLCTELPVYPDTMHLKTMVHLRNNSIRPRVQLEQTDHPLSVDQERGIAVERALELVHLLTDANNTLRT